MTKDTFDELIESEIREAKRPKMEPPPGMVGTPQRRTEPARFRLTPPKESATAKFFYGLGIFAIAATLLLTVLMTLYVGAADAVYILLAGSVSAGLWFAIAGALECLNATAHWSEQTAKAIFHQDTAAKGD